MARRKYRDYALAAGPGGTLVVVPYPEITVYEPGTTTPIAATLYAGATGGTTLINPFTGDAGGAYEFYLDAAQDVKLKIDGSSAGYGITTIDHEPMVPDSSNFVTTNTTQIVTADKQFYGRLAFGDAAISPDYFLSHYKQNVATSNIALGVGLTNVGTSLIESGGIQSFLDDAGHAQMQGINSHIIKRLTTTTRGHIAAGTGTGWRTHPFESSMALEFGVLSKPSSTNVKRYGHGYAYYATHAAAITQMYPWTSDAAFRVTPSGSGTYTLTVAGYGTTGPLPATTPAASVEANLEGLGIAAANVEVWAEAGTTLRVVLRSLGISTTLLTGSNATVTFDGNGDPANSAYFASGGDGHEFFLFDQPSHGLTDRPYFCAVSTDPQAARVARDRAFFGIGGIVPSYPLHVFDYYRADNEIMAMIQQVHAAGVTPVHLRLADSANAEEYLALGYNTLSNYGVMQALDDGAPVPIVLQPGGGKVGVGTASVTGRLQVLPTAAEIGLIVQGNTSQTANLMEWWTVGGTKLGQVDATAKVAIPALTVGQTTNGTALLHVKQTTDAGGTNNGIRIVQAASGSQAASMYLDAAGGIGDFYFQHDSTGTTTQRYLQFKGGANEIYTPAALHSNTAFHVQGLKVVGVRGAAVANAAGSSAAEVATVLNALLARLRVTGGHGLIGD